MNDIAGAFANIPLELSKEREEMKAEREHQISLTVDEWMKDEGTVETELLKAVQEVSGDMALIIAASEKHGPTDTITFLAHHRAMVLLVTQIRKQMRESVEEHLFS